jgi:hypothetical protein
VPEQKEFIEHLRRNVDAKSGLYWDALRRGPERWKRIECVHPAAGISSPPSRGPFIVRVVSMWVPHISYDFTPHCPKCESNKRVDLAKSTWDKWTPPRVFGVSDYWYLDSPRYYCVDCPKRTSVKKTCTSFKGSDPLSIQHATPEVKLLFGYHLAKQYAVDEELHHYLTIKW